MQSLTLSAERRRAEQLAAAESALEQSERRHRAEADAARKVADARWAEASATIAELNGRLDEAALEVATGGGGGGGSMGGAGRITASFLRASAHSQSSSSQARVG